ncbi:putative CRAL/TRIO domain-containing protein [Operophtera brumata]|uniref:Putative CRAL/TRIO domain-containing protein n=1 Tax=Operophtera brumata TaxID=104452 RepID=A0A0L7L3C1_OPEBR|nr:putative CRAL/TRIO domain-containing protein [Operophtera brumata]
MTNTSLKTIEDKLVMESLPKNNLLEFNPDTLEAVRKEFNLDKPGRVDEAIDILDEWVKKQAHFMKKDFNFTDANLMSFVTRLNIVELRQALTLLMDGYGMRLKGLHIITPSMAITAFVSVLKQVLSEKLGGRIHSHKTIETVYEYVPKNILPAEYGGELQSLKKLNEAWLQVFTSREYTEYLLEMNEAKTVESCRQGDKLTEQYIGMPGSFRTDPILKFNPTTLEDIRKCWNLDNGRMEQSLDILEESSLPRKNSYRLQRIRRKGEIADRQTLYIEDFAAEEGFGARLRGIHLLTESKVIDLFIKTLKPMLSAKLADRVYVSRDIKELHNDWLEVLSSEEHEKHLAEMKASNTDESLRTPDQFNEQIMGLPGSFRTLTVDYRSTMESIPDNPLLKFNPTTLEDVRKCWNLDKGRLEQSLDILEEWISKQNHFINKSFNKLCTLRTLLPKFFISGDVKKNYAELSKIYAEYLMMHEYTNGFIIIVDYRNINILEAMKNLNLLEFQQLITILLEGYGGRLRGIHFLSHSNMVDLFFTTFKPMLSAKIASRVHFNRDIEELHGYAEYLMMHEYTNGFIIIVDYRNINILEAMKNLNLLEFQQLITILLEGYGGRLRGIHFLSHSNMVDLFFTTFKPMLSAKIASRVHFNRDIEELHGVVDKELLPAEYEGKQKSTEELNNDWFEVLSSEEHEKHLAEMKASNTDESLRTPDKFNEQIMGLPGSFRTLTVD